ncbi:MAG: hypothetical protein EOL97_15800 [Spirochaetia bacterium]|nr:hypothetical protein [Spirochaetia bacterium]
MEEKLNYDFITSRELSSKAKVYLMLILTDENINNTQQLQKLVHEGITSVRSGVRELIDQGYLRITRTRDNQDCKFSGTIWTASPTPEFI